MMNKNQFRCNSMLIMMLLSTLMTAPTITAALSSSSTTSSYARINNNRQQKPSFLPSSSLSSTVGSSTEKIVSINGGATPPPPPATMMAGDIKSPKDIYDGIVNIGIMKSKYSIRKTIQLGIVAGIHIGFGSYLALSVGGNVPALAASNPGLQKFLLGAIGLPTGLIMTLITGGELFTGNTAICTTSYMENKITKKQLLTNWFYSYLGNLIGSIWLAYLAYQSGTIPDAAMGPINIATTKVFAATFQQNIIRGILCNFLVCIAVYMASGCTTMISKMSTYHFILLNHIIKKNAISLDKGSVKR